MARIARLTTLVVVLGGLVAATPAAARPFEVGYFDTKLADDGERPGLLADAQASGSRWVRLSADWSGTAPTRPRDAGDPRDPAYRWASLDRQVAAARARGQKVLVNLSRAPRWAEGSGRPRSAVGGTWRPDPRATGQFARALALRYRGRAAAYQVWNEPNISQYLAPQWVRRGGRLVRVSPGHYRAMLNAAYAGIRSVDRRSPVVTAGTSPFGFPRPEGSFSRIYPLVFWRDLVSRTVRFDVAAHHPYSPRGPLYDSPAGTTVPGIGRILAAVRAGRVLPRGPKRLWVTEWSWDTNPPDPRAIGVDRVANWLRYSLYSFWRQGVDTALWYNVRDDRGDLLEPGQSGTYLAGGQAKPLARAFRFPFVTAPDGRGRVRLWARAPRAGRLVVERSQGGSWRTVASAGAGRGTIFSRRRVRLATGTLLRARVGGETSLPWRVGREVLR